MNKEIVYYTDQDWLSIHSYGDGKVCFEVGQEDDTHAAILDRDSVRDLIASLTDMFIKTKDM